MGLRRECVMYESATEESICGCLNMQMVHYLIK